MVLPGYVIIQNIDKCNLHCSCCKFFSSDSIINHTGETMNSDLFIKILTDLREYNYTEYVCLGNYCEPLTDPYVIEKTKLIKEYGMKSNIITNGILLKQKVDQGIILDFAMVSILGDLDGEFSYKKITGIDYNTTMDTILYAASKGIRICICASISFSEEKTIRYLVDKIKSYSNISILLGQVNIDGVLSINKIIFNKISKYLLDNNIQFEIQPSIASQFENNNKGQYICDLPFTSLSIYKNGDVEMCCLNYHIIGNINKDNAVSIFNNKYIENLRSRLHKINGTYDNCDACIRDLSYPT